MRLPHRALPPRLALRAACRLCGLGCLLLAAPAFVRGNLAPEYAGDAACRACHPNVWLNFYKNPHARTQQTGRSTPGASGCESCHGPGAGHVAAKGDKDLIVAFSQLEPAAVLSNCLQCHADSLGRMEIQHSSHTQARVACHDCHSIHRAQSPRYLLAAGQRDLCYSCHANVRAQFAMPFKHRVSEGVVACTDCHNPHGSPSPGWTMGPRPRMVEAALGNEEPCMRCHTDKRGPFAFEHPAVRVEGCAACHVPHGSAHARMLRRPAVFTLCLECHTGAGGFGRQGDGIRRTSLSHDMANPRFHNCTTCHVRIHGSNSDPRFLR
jgi:DmsE family decaheme c-type cytochrome